jgi:hypothetical protein
MREETIGQAKHGWRDSFKINLKKAEYEVQDGVQKRNFRHDNHS